MSMVKTSFEIKFVKKVSQNIVILIPKNQNLNILKFTHFEGNIPNILIISDIKRNDLTKSEHDLEFIVEILSDYILINIPVVDDHFTQQSWGNLIAYFNEYIKYQQQMLFHDDPEELFSVSEDQIIDFIRHYYPKFALQLDDGQIMRNETEDKLIQIRQLMNKIINMSKSELEKLNVSIGDIKGANATADNQHQES